MTSMVDKTTKCKCQTTTIIHPSIMKVCESKYEHHRLSTLTLECGYSLHLGAYRFLLRKAQNNVWKSIISNKDETRHIWWCEIPDHGGSSEIGGSALLLK